MKYYPTSTLILNDLHQKLSDYKCNTKKIKLLLTAHGLLRYVGKRLFKFKIGTNEDNGEGTLYAGGIEWKISGSEWIKSREVFHIPPEHMVVEITRSIFSREQQSKTQFIVEWRDGHISDYHVHSDHPPDSHILKEDITSLLSLLN